MDNRVKTEERYRMQIKWNMKTTEWFHRASDYTGFHDRLAEILEVFIGEGKSMIDLGCGAGLIDFKLAKKMDYITCVDREEMVIYMLRDEISHKGLSNIQAILADINNLLKTQSIPDEDKLWDIGLMLFVNAQSFPVKELLKLVKDRLLIVERGGCINNPYVGERAQKEHSLLPVINYLFHEGIRAHVTDYTLEYGQPFVSLKEAKEYVEFYHKNSCNESIEHYLHNNIVTTDRVPYRYYLPYKKHFGVFEIKKSENMHLVAGL